jgi:hypothetical protein
MDLTITYDDVTTLVRTNLPALNPHPNFERIGILCRPFEHMLQCLPCLQITLHGWKGMVMAQELYTLLTPNTFCLPNRPGQTNAYVHAMMPNQLINTSPFMQKEQATIDMHFACTKNYFVSMQNIERAWFTALDESVDNALKVSDDPSVRGWHAGMCVINILDQLSKTYGQLTLAVLALNDAALRIPYWADDAPEVLFCWIKDCTEIALLGHDP